MNKSMVIATWKELTAQAESLSDQIRQLNNDSDFNIEIPPQTRGSFYCQGDWYDLTESSLIPELSQMRENCHSRIWLGVIGNE